MQKEIFTKFIAKLEQNCRSVLVGVQTDYRRVLAHTSYDKEHFFWPLDSQSRSKFERRWQDLTCQRGGLITPTTIPVMFGRLFKVPESCNGVARFTFNQLCALPVGAADYIAIAQNYHTIFIEDIPTMSMRISDKARRFITLVDELYNHHCCLICTAASSIDDLFLGADEGTLFDLESFQFETEIEETKLRRDVLSPGDVAPVASTNEARESIQSLLSGREEMFAFRRAVSRLIEMQTPAYLQGVRRHPRFQRLA
jgi:predicted ATPase